MSQRTQESNRECNRERPSQNSIEKKQSAEEALCASQQQSAEEARPTPADQRCPHQRWGDSSLLDRPQAVEEFLRQCGSHERLKLLPAEKQRAEARKFLFARKWDVRRSVELFKSHERLRRSEGFDRIDLSSRGVRAELLSEKFTILSGTDPDGAVVALFAARRHRPPSTTHADTLRGLAFQLDAALASESAQRNGLVFVYDMTDSKYTNFDYDLSIKILNFLKGNYPARLKKVLIVTAPIWFKAPFQVLRLFVREKLRDRVHTVSKQQLRLHLPGVALPAGRIGDACVHDHRRWLREAFQRLGRQPPSDFFDQQAPAVADDAFAAAGQSPDEDEDAAPAPAAAAMAATVATVANEEEEEASADAGSRKRSPSPEPSGNSPSKKRSTGGRTLDEFGRHVAGQQRDGLVREFESELGPDRDGGQCDAFRQHRDRNRYVDVPCADASRVQLRAAGYVHANWVDGYKRPRAYICTQGPLDSTVAHFWEMVWQEGVGVVVMTTRLVEARRRKCAEYWPRVAGQSQTHGDFRVVCESVTEKDEYVETQLRVEQKGSGQGARQVRHLQFTDWPDFGIPQTPGSFLVFLHRVDSLRDEFDGPVLVHCSAGIGRTGTFITVDISIKRLLDVGTVDILQTVRRVRKQRAGSIQTAEQYVFCHIALLEFAAKNNLLSR